LNIIKKKNFIFIKKNWSKISANLIYSEILKIHSKKETVNIALTGGRTSKKIYKYLNKLLEKYEKKINFYLGDERYVSYRSNLSNSFSIKKNLLNYRNKNHKFFTPNTKNKIQHETLNYAKKINVIDILLLSLGDDGHIASIFPKSKIINSANKYIYLKNDWEKFYRISISPRFIRKIKNKFIFVEGKKKLIVFNTLRNNKNYMLPANLVYKDGIWLIKK
tara:strand:- start:606 stop:1265 length:660 start_codon:yes stop_codon:yes gene_type:complete